MSHACHNPNCGLPCPPHLVCHRSEWFALPRPLRTAVWINYRPGQEDDKRPTKAYVIALQDCIDFWVKQGTRCRVEAKPVSRERIHEIAQGVTQ